MIAPDGSLLANEEKLREEAPKFYENLFNNTSYCSSLSKLVIEKVLTQEAVDWLIRPISDTEVKKAIFQFNPDKAPGSDGYNTHSFQRHWSIVGKYVTSAIKSSFQNGRLLKEINHTLLILVPKSHNATFLTEYRPISCCQLLYKCISKVYKYQTKASSRRFDFRKPECFSCRKTNL